MPSVRAAARISLSACGVRLGRVMRRPPVAAKSARLPPPAPARARPQRARARRRRRYAMAPPRSGGARAARARPAAARPRRRARRAAAAATATASRRRGGGGCRADDPWCCARAAARGGRGCAPRTDDLAALGEQPHARSTQRGPRAFAEIAHRSPRRRRCLAAADRRRPRAEAPGRRWRAPPPGAHAGSATTAAAAAAAAAVPGRARARGGARRRRRWAARGRRGGLRRLRDERAGRACAGPARGRRAPFGLSGDPRRRTQSALHPAGGHQPRAQWPHGVCRGHAHGGRPGARGRPAKAAATTCSPGNTRRRGAHDGWRPIAGRFSCRAPRHSHESGSGRCCAWRWRPVVAVRRAPPPPPTLLSPGRHPPGHCSNAAAAAGR